MGILRDVITMATQELDGEFDPLNPRNKTKHYSSMAKQASEGTLQFPSLVTRALEFDVVQKVSNACERNCASFAQIVLTMNPTLDTNKGDTIDYLRSFHQNMDTNTDSEDIANIGVNAFEGMNNIETKMFVLTEAVQFAQLKNELREHGIDFVQGKLNDIVRPRSVTETHVILPSTEGQRKVMKEANAPKPNNSEITLNITQKGKVGSDNKEDSKTTEIVMRNILRDNDVKKSNELVPTLLHIRVIATDSKGKSNINKYVDFVIGIKSTIHPIKSEEMVENIVDACKNHDGFFKFIKWTTGEISFLSDFLLNISEAKKDIFNQSAGSSPWWIALKRRRSLANVKKSMFMMKRILPNASIVISSDEAEYIKVNHGFDLMDPVFISKIMDKFFLLAFVIVDSATEVVHFKYDGQTNYQTVTLAGLEKENSNSARSFKDNLKAVQRI